mgnify:CR=1 FL=1
MTRELFTTETASARRPRGLPAAGPTEGREGAQGPNHRAGDALCGVQGSTTPQRNADARAASNRDQRAHILDRLAPMDADQIAAFEAPVVAEPFTLAERVLASLPQSSADALIEHVAESVEPAADPDALADEVMRELNALVADGSIVARDGGLHLAHHLDARVYMGREDIERRRPWAVAEDNAPVRLPARRRA